MTQTARTARTTGMTRGIRNNNPLNLRHSCSKWLGMCEDQTDRCFVQFNSRLFGYRAAFRTLRTYIQRNYNTLFKIIRRWAPAADGNNVSAYVDYVARTTGIDPDQVLRFDDKQRMVDLVRSMAQVESAVIEQRDILERAYDLSN